VGVYRTDDGQGWMHIRARNAPGSCASPALPGDNLEIGPRCGRMAPYLCDATVETRGQKVTRTCDAPMCERHRTNVGPDRDLCPKHAPAKEAGSR
jgi:hypothetical protein